MTADDIIHLVDSMAAIRAVYPDAVDRKDTVRAVVDDVVSQIASAYDWAFVLDVADETTDGTAAEYSLQGNRKDCRDIINIRFGQTDFELLDKKTAVDMDEWLTDRDPSGTHWWYPSGRDSNGFPKITLVDTPDADYTIRYRYRKGNVNLGDFPPEFSNVFVLATAARLLPDMQALYERELGKVISRHSAGGGEDDPARRNYWIMRHNNATASKFGY